tara:strand:- start:376 stop:2382 length:2007 start_codon:yes stop_codon:yes gene_type:complete
MITKIFEIITKTGKAEKDLKNVSDGVENVNVGLETTNKETKKLSLLGKGFGAAKKGAKGLASGFKLVGTAIKAAGIGLVVGLFIALKTAIEQNQKVIDALAVVMETVSVVMSEVSKVLTNVYESVASSSENFDALGRVLKNILNIAITPVKLAFQGIKAAIVGAQLAWEQSWLGNNDPKRIAELKAELTEIKEDVIDIGTEALNSGKAIAEDFVEAVTEVADIGSQVITGLKDISIKAAIETAKTNVELKKTAELATVANQGLIEKYDLQAEQQRQIRDDERNSIAERKKANDELLVILDKQEKAMLSNAKAVLAAAQVDLNKSKDNVEFQKAVMEAENELAAVRAQVAGFRSEQQSNDLALSKEEMEMTKSKLESEVNLSIEQKRFNAEQIQDNLQRLEKQKEIDAQEREIQTTRLQGIVNDANAGTQAKIDAQIALNEFNQQANQQEVTRQAEIDAEELRILTEFKANETRIKKEADDEQKINDDAARADNLAAEQQMQDLKRSAVQTGLTSISQLTKLFAGESEREQKKAFEINKAVAIASTLIQTYQSAQGAYLSQLSIPTPDAPIRAAIAAGIATTAGLVNVATIAKQKFQGSGGGTTPTTTPPTGGNTSPSQPPSFSVVGQSGFNQVAGALGSQPPIQAFVVAGAVTNAQQLSNNTIQQATF